MSAQGWDRADFHCGRCGGGFTAQTEAEYLLALTFHQSAHQLVDVMPEELRTAVARILAQDPATA